jgi:mediator of RNA polymerase II transcription subunit 14
MKMHLCGNEYLAISIDARTGKFTLRDTGDLASAGRKPVLNILTERINHLPHELLDRLVNLRYTVSTTSITANHRSVERSLCRPSSNLLSKKHNILDYKLTDIATSANKVIPGSLRCNANICANESPLDIASLGMDVRVRLFIKLSNSSNYYLVVLATDSGFRFAIIQVRQDPMSSDPGQLSIVNVGRLDVKRIHGDEITIRETDLNVMLTDSESVLLPLHAKFALNDALGSISMPDCSESFTHTAGERFLGLIFSTAY